MEENDEIVSMSNARAIAYYEVFFKLYHKHLFSNNLQLGLKLF